MAIIYHITTLQDWNEAQEKGFYTAPSLATEGFIHNSEDHQVAGVLERYYKHKKDLVKLCIDTEKLVHPLKYEYASSVKDTFPHIYGPLNVNAVIEVQNL